MCLYQVLERFEPDETEFTVYKVLTSYYSFLVRSDHRLYTNTWMQAYRKKVYAEGCGDDYNYHSYETGFHCFFTESDAEKYRVPSRLARIVKCKARGLEYVGYQATAYIMVPCATFTELYIPG